MNPAGDGMEMHGFAYQATGLPALIWSAVVFVIVFWPVVRILQRTGHSGWWVLLALLPVVNLIALYALALKRWPVDDNR